MTYAVQAIQRFINAPAWQGFNIQPYAPFAGVGLSGSTLGTYIRANASTCVFLTVCKRAKAEFSDGFAAYGMLAEPPQCLRLAHRMAWSIQI
jgi:hypothetical protein